MYLCFFFLNARAPPDLSPLPHHDALPIPPPLKPCSTCSPAATGSPSSTASTPSNERRPASGRSASSSPCWLATRRSEEHTSELQSRQYLVCRLLLEKKKIDHKIASPSPTT